jgi:acylpyruvate hydrolase
VHTEERLGALVGEKVLDLNSAYASYLKESKGKENTRLWANAMVPPCMKSFLSGGDESMAAAEKAMEYVGENVDALGLDGERLLLPMESVRLRAPVPLPGKVYCVALNFSDHATERIEDPDERRKEMDRLHSLNLEVPVIFQKPPSLVVSPNDPIIKPRVSNRLDYECELAVVIGKKGKYIPRERAYEYIAGYTILIDVSFRDQGYPTDVDFNFYKRDINWTKGKGMDNAAPMGPCLVTRDEIPDPHNPPLKIITRVNGQTRQDGDLSTMLIGIPILIEHLSKGTTLEPGDVIATGTVAGVARSWPDGFLKIGNTLECEIPQIGILRHRVVGE